MKIWNKGKSGYRERWRKEENKRVKCAESRSGDAGEKNRFWQNTDANTEKCNSVKSARIIQYMPVVCKHKNAGGVLSAIVSILSEPIYTARYIIF